MSVALSPELRLVVACCTWPPSAARAQSVRAAADAGVDWDMVCALVERHRVRGLVYDGLRSSGAALPEAVERRLVEGAANTARHSLFLAGEALRLQDLLDRASVRGVFLKGTALAKLAYGNIGIKQAWDIDLLVAPQNLMASCTVLAAAGYRRLIPAPDVPDDLFLAWSRHANEAEFVNDANHTHVELHWRVSRSETELSHITARAPGRDVPVMGQQTLRTLADADHFSYLCVHGAHHGWFRLKWLADLAAWLNTLPAEAIEDYHRQACAHRVGASTAQSLRLCEVLFGTVLPPALSASLAADPKTAELVDFALAEIATVQAPAAGGESLRHKFRSTLYLFALTPRPLDFARSLFSGAFRADDLAVVKLPPALFAVYLPLRPFLWLWRRVLRRRV
jgi:hypothetical protein